MTGEGYSEFDFGYELGYRSDFLKQPAPAPYTLTYAKLTGMNSFGINLFGTLTKLNEMRLQELPRIWASL